MTKSDTIDVDVQGMTCASCAVRIERVLGRQEGVEEAVVNFAGQQARAVVDPDLVDLALLQASIDKIGYEITPSPRARIAPHWMSGTKRRWPSRSGT